MRHIAQAKRLFESNRYLRAGGVVRWAFTLGCAGGIAVAYYAAARFGLAFLDNDVAVFWPASGIAVGMLITLDRRMHIALLIGVLAATVAANLTVDSLWPSLFKGLCYASEPVLTVWLIQHWFGRKFALDDLRRVLGFVAAACLGVATTALGGAATMTQFHSAEPFWEAWRTWLMADWVGIVVVVPLITELAKVRREVPSQAEAIEGVGVLALMALASIYVVTHPLGSWISFDPYSLVLPLLLWLTARCPPPFGVAGAFVASVMVIGAATLVIGRFGDAGVPIIERVRGAQVAITMVTLCTLVLAALFAQRKKAEEELRKSEAKFAGMLKIAGDAIISLDANHRITLFNEAAERLFGYLRGEMIGQPMDLLMPTRFHAAHQGHIERFASGPDIARRMGERQEVIARRKNGEEFHTEATISKLDVGGERLYTAVLRDITERKHAEEHQRILVGELDHRVKNALATVSTVISQTRQGSKSLADFVETLNGRICSMATTHELLSFSRWQGVSLAELVRRELAPYATRNNTEINGPDVVVRPEAGQVMAMVLHELTTNAAKYGALSTKNGRVSIRWDQRPIAHSPLVLEWHETGGPPVVAPSKPSYGTSTIRDLIPYEFGGAVDLVLAPSGVRCRIELPADWLGNESQPVSEAIARAPSRII